MAASTSRQTLYSSDKEKHQDSEIEEIHLKELEAHVANHDGHVTSLSIFVGRRNPNPVITFVPSCLFKPEFDFITSLRILDLSRNQIKALPTEIGTLAALTELDVSRNQLRKLPVEIGRLKFLTKLDISCNAPFRAFQTDNDQSLNALSTLGNLRLLDLRKIPRIGFIGSGHPEFFLKRLPNVDCPMTTPEPNLQPHAADRDATLLRSQLEPHTVGTLRRRLALVYGDHTDPQKVSREEVLDRLLQHHQASIEERGDIHGDRLIKRIQGVPACRDMCAELLQEMDKWVERDIERRKKPGQIFRERTTIRAQHYMILSTPQAFSTGTTSKQSQKAKSAALKVASYSTMFNLAIKTLEQFDSEFAKNVTAIAFTKNFEGSAHIDTQNTGPFYGLAMGDFEPPGGALCVEVSAREVAHVDTKYRFGKVDGRYPHWVAPYTGNRYSCIFYRTQGDLVERTTAIPTYDGPPLINDPPTYPKLRQDSYYHAFCKESGLYKPSDWPVDA